MTHRVIVLLVTAGPNAVKPPKRIALPPREPSVVGSRRSADENIRGLDREMPSPLFAPTTMSLMVMPAKR